MRYLLLLLVLPYFATGICLRFFPEEDTTGLWYKHVLFWNKNMNEFEKLEALTMNCTAFCNVNAVNDLRGETLVIGVYPRSPFVMQSANKTEVTGFVGEIWTILQDFLEFKTVYRRVNYYLTLLMNGDIQAVLVASAVYEPSTSYHEYSLPLTTNSYAMFVQPEGEVASRTWYLNTFHGDLWLMIFIFSLCIVCSIMGTYYLKKLVCADYTEFHDELYSPLFSSLYVLGGITGQGFQKMPKSWSLRLIILSCLTLGLLLSCGFSSTLTSDLANRKYSVPFTTLEEVAMKRTHTLCVRNDSIAYLHFIVNETEEIKDEWKELLNHDCPDMTDNADFATELCNPGFVYLEEPNIFQLTYDKVPRNCSFIQLPEIHWTRRISFLYSRLLQHKQLFNMYILRMHTAGILNYLKKKWMLTKMHCQCSYNEQRTFQPVGFEHINSVFLGFFIMIVLSVFICFLENVWYKLRLKRKKTNCTLVSSRTRCNMNLNVTKVRRKSRPRIVIVRRCPTIRPILPPEIMRDLEFFQNVTVRVNRW